MARYYFHVENSIAVHDRAGVELPTLEAAFDHAKAVGTAKRVPAVDGTESWNIVITDEAGDFVALVPCDSSWL
jgi:hypothetical protein